MVEEGVFDGEEIVAAGWTHFSRRGSALKGGGTSTRAKPKVYSH